MPRPTTLLPLLALLPAPQPRAGAARPDLSGVWQAGAAAATPVPAADRPGQAVAAKARLTIAQDGATLTLSGGAVTNVYALDGAETTNHILRASGQRFAIRSRARWDGGRLVLTDHLPFSTGAHTITREISVGAGGRLVIRETNAGPVSTHTLTTTYARQRPVM
jgi:hypothetical protein